jgi:lipopolysaccharide biosynthesis protein
MSVKAIAFYLPQFHPIPENDIWWGKGFTEWTNVAKAKPLYPGHYQPHLPGELGFYDLRVPETRQAQADLAREYGVDAFCYWHYWFAGERLLDRPFAEVLESGKPDFPFCLAWANETWSGIWHGSPKTILKEQTYPGEADFRAHFEYLLTAFRDRRYVLVGGKPLLVVYRPRNIPNVRQVVDLWRRLARDAGFPGLHLVAVAESNDPAWSCRDDGFDAVTIAGLVQATSTRHHLLRGRISNRAANRLPGGDLWRNLVQRVAPFPEHVFRYESVWPKLAVDWKFDVPYYPSAMPNWDNTPRSGMRGWVLHGSSPELFRRHVEHAVGVLEAQNVEEKILFVKSWNEWAEGNHLEPDQRYGRGFLEALRDGINRGRNDAQAKRTDAGRNGLQAARMAGAGAGF